MNTNLIIRRAKRSDIDQIAHLSRLEIEGGLNWSWTPKRLLRYCALASTNAYVAEIDGKFAGFSIASLGDVRAHLVLLAVEPRYRKRGVGLELLNWQITAAQTAGLTDMSLEVRVANRVAQLFYASVGFMRIRLLPNYYCGVEDAVRYRLEPIRTNRQSRLKTAPQRKKFS